MTKLAEFLEMNGNIFRAISYNVIEENAHTKCGCRFFRVTPSHLQYQNLAHLALLEEAVAVKGLDRAGVSSQSPGHTSPSAVVFLTGHEVTPEQSRTNW